MPDCLVKGAPNEPVTPLFDLETAHYDGESLLLLRDSTGGVPNFSN